MSSLTPMMQQYIEIKEQYKDCILFFRLGDFYEMFFEDAEIASRELEITLTGRDCGLEERAPMCGVPFHSVEPYISKLVNKGYKVAICEQVEDPALAKGIVKREVIRVVTPGTVTESSMLDEKKNNYLLSIYNNKYFFGLAAVDISTGEFSTTQIVWGNTVSKLMDEIGKYSPSEIIVNTGLYNDNSIIRSIKRRFSTYIYPFDDEYFKQSNAVERIKFCFNDVEFLKSGKDLSICASGALLAYLEQTQKVSFTHIQDIHSYEIEEFMVLDVSSRRHLELTHTMRDMTRKGSLLWVLDRTITAMGGRTIRKWIEQPLIKVDDIQERLDAVAEMKDKYMVRMEIRELLKSVYDIERLMSKIVIGTVNCRDLVSLKNSIGQVPYIKKLLKECYSSLNVKNYHRMDTLDDIYDLIDKAIVDDPPVSVKEGGIIKSGYNKDVDKLRKASTEGKNWIAALEASEREKTGIKNLRVGFNKVFGYYIEVTKSYYSLVPDNYIRKQTLANSERYITPELKEIEDTILGAEEKVVELEYNLFIEIKEKIAGQVSRIKNTAVSIGEVDTICALAEVADRESYCMPEVNREGEIIIKDGRHPVVEKMIESGAFVPNDVFLDMEDNRVLIITGPNMAGKSTYMRQVALIVLMAQIGSFVPASLAKIGVVDKIFTRVGATDDLASGQSTFMVEMSEVANILNNATARSLLILDEVGRGTSTFDGLSIAWAVIEYISDKSKVGARTLFSTHYYELTDLEGKIPGVNNYCITVEEKGDDIVFLRKIVRGGANDSYGIQVARLAGLPEQVIKRAREILNELEEADISKKETRIRKSKKPLEGQIDIFSYSGFNKKYDELINEIKKVDVTSLTPIEALNVLYNLQQKALK
ncbi:MAG: DNA mismatch repair protein MutS [Firmicutes bacterium]|nr:DNA mismatch repair protein MutS [Bacillota bacterium]